MKNENIFPMVRNNYFFGKLMTEREYDIEQVYFNNKRRLLNSALFSPGVVCGFNVTKVDGGTIAVESGMGIDGLGRELVVPQIIVMRLSELSGFAGDHGLAAHVYLCAEYAETPIEPCRAMGGGSGSEHFSYTSEAVRLFLRYGEPEPFEISRTDKAAYRSTGLEKLYEDGERMQLYLAKIYLVRWEEAYEIDRIEQLPFQQYATVQAYPDTPALETATETKISNNPSRPEDTKAPPFISLGVAKVEITQGAKQGSIYYSKDIPHNLGLVPVTITLGLSQDCGTVFGDVSIFKEKPPFDYAARLLDNEGIFQIGVRLNAHTQAQTLSFTWSAVTDPSRAEAYAPEIARILVQPSVCRMKPLDALRLSAEVYGLPEGEVTWSVREMEGGSITRGGVYTAPPDAGVYTIVAKIGDVFGQAFVVVQ